MVKVGGIGWLFPCFGFRRIMQGFPIRTWRHQQAFSSCQMGHYIIWNRILGTKKKKYKHIRATPAGGKTPHLLYTAQLVASSKYEPPRKKKKTKAKTHNTLKEGRFGLSINRENDFTSSPKIKHFLFIPNSGRSQRYA